MALGRIVRTLSFICFAVLLSGCATDHHDCRTLVAQIHNDHIKWDASIGGLILEPLQEPEKLVLRIGGPCRPYLLEALDDDSRFIAAHVLLTFITRRFAHSSHTEWEGLRINLGAQPEIPSGQKEKIKRIWTPQ